MCIRFCPVPLYIYKLSANFLIPSRHPLNCLSWAFLYQLFPNLSRCVSPRFPYPLLCHLLNSAILSIVVIPSVDLSNTLWALLILSFKVLVKVHVSVPYVMSGRRCDWNSSPQAQQQRFPVTFSLQRQCCPYASFLYFCITWPKDKYKYSFTDSRASSKVTMRYDYNCWT